MTKTTKPPVIDDEFDEYMEMTEQEIREEPKTKAYYDFKSLCKIPEKCKKDPDAFFQAAGKALDKCHSFDLRHAVLDQMLSASEVLEKNPEKAFDVLKKSLNDGKRYSDVYFQGALLDEDEYSAVSMTGFVLSHLKEPFIRDNPLSTFSFLKQACRAEKNDDEFASESIQAVLRHVNEPFMQKHPGETAELLAVVLEPQKDEYQDDIENRKPAVFKEMFRLHQKNPDDEKVASVLYKARHFSRLKGRRMAAAALNELRSENKGGEVMKTHEDLIRKSYAPFYNPTKHILRKNGGR